MKTFHWILYVALLAASVTWVVWGVDRGPFDRVTVGQEQPYWSTAQALNQGNIEPARLGASREPLYPRLLAPLAAGDPAGVRSLLRGLLLALASVLVLVLLRHLGTEPLSALAGSLVPFVAGPLVFLADRFSPGMPAALVLLGAALLLMGQFGWIPLLAAAILTGVGQWLHPLLGWVTLGLLTWGLWRSHPGPPRRATPVFLVAALATTFALGAAMHSTRLLPEVSGIEMYQGHRAHSGGGHPLVTDTDPARFWSRLEYAAHGSREAERNLQGEALERHWAGRAFGEALRHAPGDVWRTVKKTAMVLNPTPRPEPTTPAFTLRHADKPGLALALWLGRLLLPLGLVGWILAWKRLPGPVRWTAASGVIAVWIAYARDDLRALTLILFCAGVGLFIQELRNRRSWKPAAWGGLAVVALGLGPVLWPSGGPRLDALNSYWLGAAYAQDAMGSAALREFDRAAAFSADSPLPRLAVADLLVRDQVLDEATRELEAVREDYPDLVLPLLPLAQLYEQRERWTEAAIIDQALIDLNPYNPDYYNRLGVAFGAAGLLARAEEQFRKALELDPGHTGAAQNLAGMQHAGLAAADSTDTGEGPEALMRLIRDRRFAEAESLLALSYGRAGADTSQLQFLEGTLAFQKHDYPRAIRLFEALRPRYENNLLFRHNLAAAYASVGRLGDAMKIWADLVRLRPENQVYRSSLARAEQQALQAAASSTGNEAHAIWRLLHEVFPHNAAYEDSLAAHP